MEYEKLSLVELKNYCKKRNLPYGGNKNKLIKILNDFDSPEPIVVNTHKNIDLPKDKKIVGVKCGEKDKSQRIGKEREKGGVKNMYWSMGVFYYMVNKDFTFD
mgnify:CR=1 FL=1|jgi:hypothetical protein|tara:strand:+ start:1600 stop:1908 length:309 start_codon:yes stop_codon:yes gene_type:complete